MWLHAILSWRSCSRGGRRGTTASIQGLLTAPQALIEETRTLKWAASVLVWTIKFTSRRALSPFSFFLLFFVMLQLVLSGNSMYIQAFINDCTRFGGGSHEAGANCLRTAVEAACLAPVVRRSSAQRSPPPTPLQSLTLAACERALGSENALRLEWRADRWPDECGNFLKSRGLVVAPHSSLQALGLLWPLRLPHIQRVNCSCSLFVGECLLLCLTAAAFFFFSSWPIIP